MANINNGTVTVQVVGGVGPYQYTLLNAGTNQPIPNNAYPTFQNPVSNIVANTFTFGNATDNTGNSGLAPGQYKVKIIDSNLCETVSNTLFVTDATPIPPTATPVPVPTATILPTATAIIPTATPEPEPTATEVIPTATPEPEPTATEVEPTATEVIPTATPEPEPTATEVIPTATPEPEPTATEVIPTATPEPEPTATEVEPTATPEPEPTATEVIPTATPVPDPTATEVPVPTATPLTLESLGIIAGVQVEPSSIWNQFSGQYFFGNDPSAQTNVDDVTCYFTGLILTDPTKYAMGSTYQIIAGETLQVGTQLYSSGIPHYGGVIKGIVYDPMIGSYNGHFVHSATYTYVEADINGIVTYITTDTICAPAPTATPVPDPTATAIPDPTATPVPDPTATVIPMATIALVNTISGPYFGNIEGATASTLNNFLCAQGLPNNYSSYNYKTNGLGGFNVPQNGDIIYEQDETTLVTNREFMFASVVPASSILDWYYVATDVNGIATVTQMSPCPTATPTATPVPVPTATPVPDPTATAIPDPTATPVPEPTATSAEPSLLGYYFHGGSADYPFGQAEGGLTDPNPGELYYNDGVNPYAVGDLSTALTYVINLGSTTGYNVEQFNLISNDIIGLGSTSVLAFDTTSADEYYYIAVPRTATDLTSNTPQHLVDNGIATRAVQAANFTLNTTEYTLYRLGGVGTAAKSISFSDVD